MKHNCKKPHFDVCFYSLIFKLLNEKEFLYHRPDFPLEKPLTLEKSPKVQIKSY